MSATKSSATPCLKKIVLKSSFNVLVGIFKIEQYIHFVKVANIALVNPLIDPLICKYENISFNKWNCQTYKKSHEKITHFY